MVQPRIHKSLQNGLRYVREVVVPGQYDACLGKQVSICTDWNAHQYERANGGRFCLRGTAKEINDQIQEFCKATKARHAGSGISLPTQGSLEVRKHRWFRLRLIFVTHAFPDDSIAEGVPIRVYKPTNQTADLPLCLFSHGGGFVFGNLDSEDSICRLIATETPCTLVSVDYRLGPKYKLPAMVVDLIRVYHWARRPENGLFSQGSKIFAAGRSSGAALSLALANHVAQLPSGNSTAKPRLDGVIALAPITLHPNYVPHRYQDIYTSYKENEENVPVVERSTMMTFFGEHDSQTCQYNNTYSRQMPSKLDLKTPQSLRR